MALSNIFREPRREITESAIGISIFVGIVGLDYIVVRYLKSLGKVKTEGDFVGAMLLIPLITIAIGIAISGLALITHFIGEKVCDALARRELDPRPKQRYR